MTPIIIAKLITEDITINNGLILEHCGYCQTGWYNALVDKEKQIIDYLVKGDWSQGNQAIRTQGLRAVELFNAIEELIPFKGNRDNIRDWIEEAKKQGLINNNEYYKLIEFMMEQLYFG